MVEKQNWKEEMTNKELLDRAHEIRKFEIDLYWRRTAYFWTLIAAAFLAFFAIHSAEELTSPSKEVLSFVVGNLGFVFSLGWFLINRGSKFWQQNWEAQVDRLECCVGVALHRSVAIRNDKECWLVGSKPYSVSKINQITSFYVTFIWGGLVVWSLLQWCIDAIATVWTPTEDVLVVLNLLVLIGLFLFTIAICVMFHLKGRTKLHDKGSDYSVRLKTRTPQLNTGYEKDD